MGIGPLRGVIDRRDVGFHADAPHGLHRHGAERGDLLQQRLRQLPQYADVVIDPAGLTIIGTDAVKATDAQWTLVQQLQTTFPDATVTLREHRIVWKGDPQAPRLTMYGVIVTRRVVPFDLRREYAAPDT